MLENARAHTRIGKKHRRQVEAKQRDEAWQQLSAAEKLADLDRRLGKDQGAVKQRARLLAQMATEKKAQR